MMRNIKKAFCNRRGSTLIECLAALLVFSAVMTMTATMFATSSTISNRSADLSRSVNAAVNQAETAPETDSSANSVTVKFKVSGEDTVISVPISYTSTASGTVTLWRFLPPTP